LSTAGAPGKTWTIADLIAWTKDWLQRHGSPTPRLDADLLLCEVLQVRRLDLLLRFDQPVQKTELAAFKALIQRRSKGEPVAYILGRKEFYGLELAVDRRVLVPRPETESLVDAVLAFLRADGAPNGDVLDLCTGSGCIAIALGDALRKADSPRRVVATDASREALEVASANVARHGLQDRITLRQGDLWHALQPDERFAAVASNPPYVRDSVLPKLDRDVRQFEPTAALDGGEGGLAVLARIASGAADRLVPGGLLVVELGDAAQGEETIQALARHGLPGAVFSPILGGPTGMVSQPAPARPAPAQREPPWQATTPLRQP
jgi:release factor glutamine methyltransferase